ncbi:uncharacterized protein LOC144822968 isoform X2 [Lissotriton helveticus]
MERFYPQTFEISWWTTKYGVIATDSCTGYPEKNQDGTYNVTSHLRLQPSIEDNNDVYTCIVQHRSLSGPLRLNTTLTVKEKHTSLSVLIGAVVGTITVCILIVICSLYVHQRYLKIVAPKVTEITGNEDLFHEETTTLSCQITGFRPKPITVTFSSEQRGKKKSTLVYCWPCERNATKPVISNLETLICCCPSQRNTDANGIDASTPFMNNREVPKHLDLINCQAIIESHSDGTYSLSCKILIVPNIDEHNGAELCLTIKHIGLAEPIEQKRRLTVFGRPPKVSEIMEPPRIIHQESITLTCPINGFKPRPIKLTWLKKSQHMEKTLVEYDSGTAKVNYFSDNFSHTTSETPFRDGTLSILSALSFAPSITADNQAVFLCRIFHYATEEKVEKTLTLCVKAQPTLDLIQAVPETLFIEDKLTLSCRIHSFFPKTLEVKWYKNDEQVRENISISDVTSGPDGLCNCTTSITCTPCNKDVGKEFICRVGHESVKDHKGCIKHKEAKWTLEYLISSPKPLEIVCEPKVPEEGESVTLSCVVKDYYPPECEVRWFRGFQSFEAAIVEAAQLCEETGLYQRKSQLTFTPTKDDHNAEFTVEVTHRGRQLRRTYSLILKDFPVVKNIIVNSSEVMYGKPLTLSCQVMGCDPKDLTVTWFEKDKQILNGLSSRMPPLMIEDRPISCFFLDLIPTALHYNKEFVCKVKHKNLQQSINKQMYLPLKPQPPVISDITMTPAEPDATNNLHLCINVSDFAPKEIHIKWYDSWMEFSKELVTCSEPHIGANALYCASSQAKFKLQPSDKDIKIRCEVMHSSTNTVLEKKLQHNFRDAGKSGPLVRSSSLRGRRSTTGCESIIQEEEQSSEILCLTSNPKAGEIVKLKYFMAGCSTSNADVSWFDGMFPIDEDCIESLDDEDSSGCTSTVTFRTDPKNKGKECEIKCEVTKDYETTEKIYILKLT